MNITDYLKDYLINKNININTLGFDKLLSSVKAVMIVPRNIDYNKLERWLKESNLEFKGNPLAWLNKALVSELDRGTFDKLEKHCSTYSFLKILQEHGIEIKPNADLYLSIMFDYLFNEGYISQEELIELNHKSIDYLAFKGLSTDHFIELWKKSNVCKARNVDWEKIDQLYETQNSEWLKLVGELE